MAGAQEIEKVQSALRSGGAKPGKVIIANLGAVAVRGFVACAGVIDRDPGCTLQAGPQYVAGFVQEALLARGQQAKDLPLGDEDGEPPQQRHQPRHRDLSLMILSQHEATQFGAEMAINALG
jgi:hypothetical protein